MLCRMRCGILGMRRVGRAPGKSSLASLSLSPARMRSSLTPGLSAVAMPPDAMRPEALATSATVPFDVFR